jgi:hypothetical protein
MVSWVLGLGITPTEVLILLAALSWLLVWFGNDREKAHSAKPSLTNWGILGAAMAVCVFVSIPLLRNFSSATVLRYSAHAIDDTNHIALIEGNRKAGGYLYSNNNKNAGIVSTTLNNYPQGWHINGAFLESLTVKFIGRDNTTTRLLNYLFYKTLWLFMGVFFVCELLSTIARFVLTKPGKYLNFMLPFGGLALSLFLLVPLFGYGFQSYIANIALLCASFVLALESVEAKDKKAKSMYLVGLGLLAVGATYVWILAGLTIGLLAVAIIIREAISDREYFGKWPWWQWALLLAFGVLALLQIYIQSRYGQGKGIDFINSGGAIPPISAIGVVGLFVLTLLFTAFFVLKKSVWLLIFTVVATVEYLCLAGYQQLVFGEQRYYANKLAYSVALVLLAVLLPIVLIKMGAIRWSVKLKTVAYLVLLLVLPFALGLNVRKSAYPLKDGTPIKQATAKYLLTIPNDQRNIVVHTSNKNESFLATKLWSSVWSYNTTERQTLLDNMLLETEQ